jgi:hypothetical protein
MARILLLNGPNLNLLGTREPDIYGTATLSDIESKLQASARARGHELVAAQSNAEHELVARVQSLKRDGFAFVLINPGAFTHTSIALRDARNFGTAPFCPTSRPAASSAWDRSAMNWRLRPAAPAWPPPNIKIPEGVRGWTFAKLRN